MFHKLSIKQDELQCRYAKVELDGVRLRARSVRYEHSVDSVPVATIELLSTGDIEHIADVKFEFTAKTIKECCEVIKSQLSIDGSLKNAFIVSIESALKDNEDCIKEDCCTFELAEKILKRIVGED